MSTKSAKFQNMLYYTQIVFVSRQCALDGYDAKRRTFADLKSFEYPKENKTIKNL